LFDVLYFPARLDNRKAVEQFRVSLKQAVFRPDRQRQLLFVDQASVQS
jgi:hypothetical protein